MQTDVLISQTIKNVEEGQSGLVRNSQAEGKSQVEVGADVPFSLD
jgi:hypothetical protein